MQIYMVTLEVRIKRQLTEREQDVLREAILRTLDREMLPYEADVVTGVVAE